MPKLKKTLFSQNSKSEIQLKPEDVVRDITYLLSNKYRLRYITDWEGNHSTQKDAYDKHSKKCNKLRDKLLQALKENPDAEITIDIKIK